MRLGVALLAATGVVILLSPLSRDIFLPDNILARVLVFYGMTSAAYCTLPLVRRGDIAAVAMWIVLGVGISPCVLGEEISAPHMFADMGGVLMAAAPIYIARFRQVTQGDTRFHRRREGDL
jgi:hypothetical protein